jgi:hypothetical protein
MQRSPGVQGGWGEPSGLIAVVNPAMELRQNSVTGVMSPNTVARRRDFHRE